MRREDLCHWDGHDHENRGWDKPEDYTWEPHTDFTRGGCKEDCAHAVHTFEAKPEVKAKLQPKLGDDAPITTDDFARSLRDEYDWDYYPS